MEIEEKDIISLELNIVFYYRDCEVTLNRMNQLYIIKVSGISDFGNLLFASRSFIKEVNRKMVLDFLKGILEDIKEVYQSVINKEFGMDNHID